MFSGGCRDDEVNVMMEGGGVGVGGSYVLGKAEK